MYIDVLFDPLTVEEHLWLFCRLKGISNEESKRHVTEMIEVVCRPDFVFIADAITADVITADANMVLY